MLRDCADCGDVLASRMYSATQWSKGVGLSRCRDCVSAPCSAPARPPTARSNDSWEANFTQGALDNPFAEGTFRYVAKGRYTEGRRRGTLCVSKWFKSGGVMSKTYFRDDIKAVDRALGIVLAWNRANFIDKHVQINQPEVWEWSEGSLWEGEENLVEPFINNFQKWNSNTGWSNSRTPWPRVMQALSHFSYHYSAGQVVLCDLQGGISRDGIILTDPVILSPDRKYGVTDLGIEGIRNFFFAHECNEYCASDWRTPRITKRAFRPVKGTTMAYVPTRSSLPALTGRVQDDFYF